MTVAQLKALCKDLGLKNYSKLGKAALLEKIDAARAQERPAADVGAAGSDVGTASAGAAAESGGKGSTSTGRAVAAGAGSTASTLAFSSKTAPSAAPGPAAREQHTPPPSRKRVHSDLGLGGATTSTTSGTNRSDSSSTAVPADGNGGSSTSTRVLSSSTPHSTSKPRTPEEDTRGSLARPPPNIGLGHGGRSSSALSSSPSASSSTLPSSPRAYASSSTYVSAFTAFSAIAPSSPAAHASSSTLASSPPAKKRTASSAGLDRDAIVKVARTHAARASRDRFKVPPVPERPTAGLSSSTRALGPALAPAPDSNSASVGSSSRQPLATPSFQVLRPRALPLASSSSPTPTPTQANQKALKSNAISSPVINPSISQPRRRFQPLRPVTVPSANATVPPPLSAPLKSDDAAALDVQLDFTILPSIAAPAPRLITLPMSLRQRGRARNWAIILMRLTNQERAKCVLVCKAMRYGVYLSAAQILRVDFPGARLTSVVRNVALDVKDMWPYLRLRRAELAVRRAAYDMSFLPSFYARFGIGEPIAPALWTSPDHEDQLTVAIRFLIAKAWFAISLGGSDTRIREWLQGTVIDAQEVTPRNVWTITQQLRSNTETLYVVYETCEVVAKSDSKSPIPLRNDWAAHIANGTLTKKPLLEYIVWHNGEDYNRGISTAWLRRVAEQGDLGRVKRQIAERYVLACVAANRCASSYLPRWFGLIGMYFSVSDPNMPNKASHSGSLGLYLPEHHYVESVCFITILGQALHPALAAVQTPAREYIVLRDTGMHVGCEEDGVAEAWMDVLRCDTHGVAV
ncbi:hypothetical protein EXIGLDRAFT_837337 [Exidia glandulosa HHB12029]|uniref:Rho termination factor N-terminal domain-containing protein n=1 Tax=Exidia glandulosa HHB12029 TaxID=1314781 RepID=A0A165GXI2_EXIGL|nr:hypothetical protein EXIGLDRAFT_837337 [Exidia glandulosa HHB12029]